MITVVLEKMPDLFWKIVQENDFSEIVPFEEKWREKCEIAIVRTHFYFTPQVIDSFVNLKMIIRAGTGFDNIDCQYAISKGIKVCNTPFANAQSAYEQTINFIFMMIKQANLCQKNVLLNKWKSGIFYNMEISDLKVLIVGLGRIGSKVASLLQSLGAEVKAVDPYLANENFIKKNIESIDYEKGVQWCNTISYHCPLTKETKHYFSYKTLELLKNEIYLLNVARGNIVDMKAVLDGLKNGKIIGFASDVFPDEPNPNIAEFKDFENVYFSPHIGAFTKKAKDRMSYETIEVWKSFVFDNIIKSEVDIRFI